MIQNPAVVKQTSSFKIEVQDENARGIAFIEAGILYQTTKGTISDIDLVSLGGNEIEQLVTMQLEFKPKHAVVGTGFILMTLPEQVEFRCDLGLPIGLKAAPTCVEVGANQLRLENPFNANNYPGDELITLYFLNRVLPGANLMIHGIKIQTYAMIEGEEFLIDEFDQPDLEFFAPLQQLFIKSIVETGSDEVYTETEFTLSLVLANSVPSTAIMHIMIPPQIEVKDTATVEDSC